MKQSSDKQKNPSPEHSHKQAMTPRHVSLVTQAGLVMSVIVGLALLSMLCSMFVSESLDGDAAHINIAGSLRMQSVRLSRALMAQENQLEIINGENVIREVNEFKRRFEQLESGLGLRLESSDIAPIHAQITDQWAKLTSAISDSPNQFRASYAVIDQFVDNIDMLVTVLQHQSEGKIRMLRIIQSSSMFLILLTAFISLQRMTKLIVQPMNQLVRAASEAAKGNFSIRAFGGPNTEIGVLAYTFNDMSKQLQAMHDGFEQRVQEKTRQLEQSNRSLELLYRTSHNLVQPKQDEGYRGLLQQVEENLGHGELILYLNNEHDEDFRARHAHEHLEYCFDIKKRDEEFGRLCYFDINGVELESWQHQLLQTIADNIAVAISLDKKRQQENLIGLQEERAVIARELHDSLAQSLSYLKLQTALLSKQLKKELPRERVDATISDIRGGLSDAYRHLRELLTTFRLQIGDASLETALKTTAIEFSQKCGHPVTLACAIDTAELSPNEQIHVLQIVREALSNVQRHAQANYAEIKLSQHGRKIQIEVSDDGIGLKSANNTGSHHGMSIMQERAESLSAHLIIGSNPKGGTDVRVEFVANKNAATDADDEPQYIAPDNSQQKATL